MNTINEIWKPVKDYPNYQISNLGRVKSLNYNRSGEEKILKSCTNDYGYYQVSLSRNGKNKTCKIHRLVAEAFIPNPNNLPQVNHKDEDKNNNTPNNLEWCTAKYNSNYGKRITRMKDKLKRVILQFTKDGKLIKKWDSIIDVQNELGIKQSNICKCLNGKINSIGGYKWKYYDDVMYVTDKIV